MAQSRTGASAPSKSQVKATPHRTTRRTAKTAPIVSAVFDPASHEPEIAVAAYLIWLERGDAPGSPETDWSRAEADVRGRYS